jgi:hypothetical protein
LPARSIAPGDRERAQTAGALTFDAISIIGSHLSEIVRANAAELFGRQEFQTLIEHLRTTVPSIVRDVGTDVLPIVTAHRAMTLLLRERAWPRDPITVFEAMLDAAPHVREPRDLAEAARRVIVPLQFRRDNIARIRPLILAPAIDAELSRRTPSSSPRRYAHSSPNSSNGSARASTSTPSEKSQPEPTSTRRSCSTAGRVSPHVRCAGALLALLHAWISLMRARRFGCSGCCVCGVLGRGREQHAGSDSRGDAGCRRQLVLSNARNRGAIGRDPVHRRFYRNAEHRGGRIRGNVVRRGRHRCERRRCGRRCRCA